MCVCVCVCALSLNLGDYYFHYQEKPSLDRPDAKDQNHKSLNVKTLALMLYQFNNLAMLYRTESLMTCIQFSEHIQLD